jgi:ribosomal protein S3
MKSDEGETWKKAVKEGKDSLYQNKTWIYVGREKLTTFLKKGLSRLKSDNCIFKNDANSLFIAIHVDDGIIIGENERQIREILLKMEIQFQIIKTTNPSLSRNRN